MSRSKKELKAQVELLEKAMDIATDPYMWEAHEVQIKILNGKAESKNLQGDKTRHYIRMAAEQAQDWLDEKTDLDLV